MVMVREAWGLPSAPKAGLVVLLRPPLATKVPALIVTSPLKVLLLAPNVSVPAPSLVSVPVPVPMMLLIVVLPAPPTDNPKPEPVIVPVLLKVKVPASELILVALPRVTKPA